MNNRNRNWLRALGFIGAMGLCANGVALADESEHRCRETRIVGLYIFSASGFTTVAGALVPKAIVEMIRFNGDGTLSTPGLTLAVNGNVFRIPVGNSGTYALDGSCRGTVQFADGITFDMYATPRGAELSMIQTNAGNVFQGTAKKASH